MARPRVRMIIAILAAVAMLPYAVARQGSAPPQLAIDMTFRNSGSELQIRWINDGHSAYLLNMGGILGSKPVYEFRLSITTGSSWVGRVSIAEGSAALEGRLDPWVIFLPPKSEFVLRIRTSALLINRKGKTVEDQKGPWTLTLKYSGRPARDDAPGGKSIPYSLTRNGPTTIPFWVGSITQSVRHP